MEPIPTPVPPIPFAGPVLFGALFSYLFMGILLSQLAHYFQHTGATDKWAIRTLVILVFACQLIQLAFTSHKAWRVGVLGFINPEYLIRQPKHSAGTPILNGLVAIFVQAFFAWRIYKIGKDNPFMKPVPVIIALLGLLQLAASIALGIAFLRIGTDSTSLPRLSKIIPIHLGANMVADMLITTCMFVILYDFKQNTSLPRTRTLLSALIRNTVENGLITSTFAITNLVLYFTREADLTSVAFRWTIGFIYAIVLLTTLNRREEHRGDHVESGFGFAAVELTNLDLSTVNGRSRYGDQTNGHSTTSLPASTVPHDDRSATVHDSWTVNEPDISTLPAKP